MKKLYREIITSKFNKVVIDTSDEDLIRHFYDNRNYADVIIDQINSERLYDFMFKEKHDLVVLDIGANIGLFTAYIQDSASVVYCVEPTPSHYKSLTKITEQFSNVKRLQVALHCKDAPINFYLFDQNSTMNSTVNKYGNKIEVEGRTILSIMNDNNLDHVDFVKCDIEGSEMMAITPETVKAVSDRIDNWFLEIHATEHGDIYQNRDYINNIFKMNGYKTMYIKHDGLYASKS